MNVATLTQPRLILDSLGRTARLRSPAEVFWARVDRSAGAGACWEWPGARTGKGYGQARVLGQLVYAHRMAYQLATETELAPDVWVLHSCDNPPCCNPAHLRAGTPAANSADMVERGRHVAVRGPRNGRTKFTAEAVAEVRRRRAAGASVRELMAEFGMSEPYVRGLINGTRRPEVES